jgi:hypothetical protein
MSDRLLKALLIVLLIAAPSLAQTSAELRRKYGEPETLSKKSASNRIERYKVRREITMTVKFAGETTVCEMLFEPERPSNSNSAPAIIMLENEAYKLVEEFAPVSKRGKPIIKMTTPGHDCSSVTYNEYEQVMILVLARCDEKGGGIHSVKIRWKATACEAINERGRVS